MSGNNSAVNSDWVRLNVGGKVFQTTKDTLSRYPESFLAGLVNSGLPSEKDETGALLIDRDPKQFRVILNYLRNGVLNIDRNKIAVKELLCEADFYGLHALVDEISKAVPDPVRHASNRTEMVILSRGIYHEAIEINEEEHVNTTGYLQLSENREDYEVLQALRQKVEIRTDRVDGQYVKYIVDQQNNYANNHTWMSIELILRNFGFVKEEISEGEFWDIPSRKFVRTIRQ